MNFKAGQVGHGHGHFDPRRRCHAAGERLDVVFAEAAGLLLWASRWDVATPPTLVQGRVHARAGPLSGSAERRASTLPARGLSVYPPGRVGIAPDFHVLTKFLVADRPPLR